MSITILDGTGSGNKARVDNRNKLRVAGIFEDEAIFSASKGDAYNINTGYFSVTADATLGYLKNNDDKIMVVDAIAVGARGGATYSDQPYITIIQNPTGGDLITDATPVSQLENRNFGSNNEFNGDAFRGKTGGTITGGNGTATLQLGTVGRSFFTIDFFLPKGSSIGVSLTAPITGGAAEYYLAFIVHFLDVDAF